MIDKKDILLVVGGGIGAYKSLNLVRLIREAGLTVSPVMTNSAKKFITPLSLSVLSGTKARTDLYDLESEIDIGHINLSRQSDLVVVAPATANLIAKAANGIADDLASNILLATDKQVLMAPAMNVKMWSHEATKRNTNQLKHDGVKFIGPTEGSMACGEFGYGRMAEPVDIMAAIKSELEESRCSSLYGKRILVTSGPTQEPIDPVRYISNRSTGLQGATIAEALVKVGADVLFVTGPVTGVLPKNVQVINVQTADEMLQSVTKFGPYDVAICVAAVSDWRIKDVAPHKVKKNNSKNVLNLAFEKTPDILEQVSNFNPRPKLVVGFAAETEHLEVNALKKLKSKKCDWILANSVDTKSGVMGKRDTEIVLVSKDRKKVFPRMSKIDFSRMLVKDICAELE